MLERFFGVHAAHLDDPCYEAGTERNFTFDFSYNSFVPRDDPDYASQDVVWEDLGVGVLNNAYEGAPGSGRQGSKHR